MIEAENADVNYMQQKKEAKERKAKQMEEAEAEHQKLVDQEEAEEKEEQKKQLEAEQKAQDELNYQAALEKRQKIIQDAANDQQTAQLSEDMNIEALQNQATQSLVEEEEKIKSVRPTGIMARAAQSLQIEAKEKATAEALKTMSSQVNLAQLGEEPAATSPATTTAKTAEPEKKEPDATGKTDPVDTTQPVADAKTTTPKSDSAFPGMSLNKTAAPTKAINETVTTGPKVEEKDAATISDTMASNTTAPVKTAPYKNNISKQDREELEAGLKVGAHLPPATNVTVPSFRNENTTDDAAMKPLVPKANCTLTPAANTTDANATVTLAQNATNATESVDENSPTDILPYPNTFPKELTYKEKMAKSEKYTAALKNSSNVTQPLRAPKYINNFANASIGAHAV